MSDINTQRRADGLLSRTDARNELHSFTVSMPKWMVNRLDRRAAELGITRKALVNVLVGEWINGGI